MSITISSLGFQMVLVKMVGEKETLESICVCRYKAKQRGWENGNYDSRWLLWPTQYSAFGVLRPTQMALQIPTQTHLAEAEANERALLSLTWSVSVTSVQISICLFLKKSTLPSKWIFSHVWRFNFLRSRVGSSQLEEVDSQTEFGGVM